MSGTPKTDLVNDLDAFFASLLKEAQTDNVPIEGQPAAEGAAPPIGFLDKLKLFEAGARWVAVKNKVDPEDSKDEFGRLSDRFYGRARGRGTTGAKKPS